MEINEMNLGRLVELSADPKVDKRIMAIKQAIIGKREVCMYVKGNRPMFQPDCKCGTNYLYIMDYGQVSIVEICKLFGIDPALIQNIYFNYYAQEDFDQKEQIMQMVTNLLPFPKIYWRREDGSSGGSWSLGKFYRYPINAVDIIDIHEKCKLGKALERIKNNIIKRSIMASRQKEKQERKRMIEGHRTGDRTGICPKTGESFFIEQRESPPGSGLPEDITYCSSCCLILDGEVNKEYSRKPLLHWSPSKLYPIMTS